MAKIDTILLNGKVYSVGLDDAVTHAEAVAIADGIIVKVGTNEDIRAMADTDTEVVDCGGNTILPGLCDAHCHPAIAGASASSCDLFGVYPEEGRTADDIIDILMGRLKKYVDEHPDSDVIRGIGWIYQSFNPAERFPTRHDIDKICADKPVILESFCQHNLWVNTKAIEIAGVTADTPDTKIGKIHREEDGYPQGVFSDPEAMDYIKSNVPGYDLSVEEYKDAVRWYQEECANRYGVTFVQDCMASSNAIKAYHELARDGELTVRMRAVNHLEPHKMEKLSDFLAAKGSLNVGEDFRIDTMKMFAEGDMSYIGGYSPEFCKANDLPEGYNAPLYWPDDVFVDIATKSMEAGFNVHVHAMGDLAVKQSAECLAKAQQQVRSAANAVADGTSVAGAPRNIIAHLMLVPDETAELMGKEHIIANCQPTWMMHEGDVEAIFGMVGERAEQCYPFRKFIDNGVLVAFGTDFPVTPPPDTMEELFTCMNRKVTPRVPGYEVYKELTLGDEEPATLAEAVKALSIGGAYQMFGEEYTGTIEAGKSAELCVLDHDIENTPKEDIYKIKVQATYFKGKKVFEL